MVNAAKLIVSLLEDHGLDFEDLGDNVIVFGPKDGSFLKYFLWDKHLKLIITYDDCHEHDDFTATVDFVANLNEPGSIQVVEGLLCQLGSK